MEKLVFKPGFDALRLIERFIDNLCENLFINEIYYGNLLVSLNTLNDLLFDLGQMSTVKLSYETDHKYLRFTIEGVENQVYTKLQAYNELDSNHIRMEMLKQLCDLFLIENEIIIFDFEVGALHNSIYKTRANLLNAYFKKKKINFSDV